MFQLIIIILSLISIIIGYFYLFWGWIILAFPFLFLILMLLAGKRQRCSYIQELSPKANEMLNKHFTFYNTPFASRDLSSSASTLVLSGIILVIIGLFNDFWWGIAIGLGNYIVMGYVSREFNPTCVPMDYDEESAHNEITIYLSKKQMEIINKNRRMDENRGEFH